MERKLIDKEPQFIEDIDKCLDSLKYTLISKELEKYTQTIVAATKPTEELLEAVNAKALIIINHVFNGELTVEKRKVAKPKRIYYKFVMDNTMIFEYGIEENMCLEDEEEGNN